MCYSSSRAVESFYLNPFRAGWQLKSSGTILPVQTHDDLRPLTAFRALAALLVFLNHYSGLRAGPAEHWWQAVAIEGHAGVTLFFVLSGFLITLRYFPAILERRFSLVDYISKRIARILPLYWVVLGAVAFFAAPRTDYSIYLPQPLINFTLMQSFFQQLVFSGILPAWSLTIEVSFYGIAPLLLMSCAHYAARGQSIFHAVALWVPGLAAAGMMLVWLSNRFGLAQPHGFMNDPVYVLVYTLAGRGIDFAIGIFAAHFYLQRRDHLWSGAAARRSGLLLVAGLVGIVGTQVVMNRAGGPLNAWYLNAVIALFAGFVILSLTCAAAPVTKFMNGRLPVYLGSISYALYLIQTTFFVRPIYDRLDKHSPLTILVMYVLLSVAAAILYELVEKPGQRMVLGIITTIRQMKAIC